MFNDNIFFARNLCSISFSEFSVGVKHHEERNFNTSEQINLKNQNQQKKELRFSDGTIGYFISDDGKSYGVVDEAGRNIVPQKYGKITCYGGSLLYCEDSSEGKKVFCALYYKDGQCKISESDGYTNLKFVNSRGKLIVTSDTPMAVFDDKGNYMYKYKKCKDSKGFIYLKNELTDTIVVRPGKYTNMFIQDDVIRVWVGNKVGILELDGTIIIPAIKYSSITTYRNGFSVRFSKYGGGANGYIDRNGKCIIPAVNYSNVYPLDNGVFEVIANEKASIADSSGNILISTKYSGLHPVKDNNGNWYYETYLGNGKGKMSLEGKIISEPQPTIVKKQKTKDGFTYTEILDKNGMYGIVNSLGKRILPCEYKMVLYDKDILGFKLFKNGFQGISDLKGNIIIPCNKYHSVNEYRLNETLFFRVDYLGKYGLCDSFGNELIKPQFDDITPNLNGTATIQMGLVKGIIDFAENVIIPIEYSNIYSLDDGTYKVYSLNKIGICDNNGHIIIPPKYTSIEKTPMKGGDFSQLYKVKDGETTGLYTVQGEMIFPTGLFKYVSLYKKGDVLSTDPLDKVFSSIMNLSKTVGGSGASVDETKFGDSIYIKAFNDFNEGLFYYYDLKGNLICDTRIEKDFDNNFKLGQEEFDKNNYKKAIEYYKQALVIKQDAISYYNIGAAYYNLNKYKDAIKNLQSCISLRPRQSVIDDAKDLIIDCESMLQQKKEQRANIVMGILGSVLNVAATVMRTNAAIKSYNSANYDYNLPPSLNPQLAAQDAITRVNMQMAAQKSQFLTQFRTNYRATMGREPSEMEEMEAYTQFLQSMNGSYGSNQSSATSIETSVSSDYTTKTFSNSNTCGLCNGTGKIDDSVANFGITDKKWCSECGEYRVNGHYHKICPSCKGNGYR